MGRTEVNIDVNLHATKATAEMERFGHSAEGAGDDLNKMAKDAGFLDKRIGELRGEMKGLIAEFDKTGDMDLLKKINAGNRELGKVNRIKKQFTELFGDVEDAAAEAGAKAGTKVGEGILSQAAETLQGSRAILIGGLVGVGAVLSPFLGGVISSAVLGVAGGGGIIGGVALAAKDARVQDAAVKLGQQMSAAFQTASGPFIAPVVEALAELEPVVDRVAGGLHEAFIDLAPVFVPLTRGITGLVEQAMPGLTKAMVDAKPVIRAIANELPDIGHAISLFFNKISDNGDEAIQAFVTLSKAIQTATVRSGELIAFLSEAFGITVRVAGKILPVLEAIYGWVPILGDYMKASRKGIDDIIKSLEAAKNKGGDFAGALDDVADSATAAKQKMLQLNDALDHFFGIAMNSEQATIAYERSWDEMIDTLTSAKRTLYEDTEAGRKNREAIDANITAIQQMHKARVDEGMAVEDSIKIRDRDLERLRAQLIQLGYNKQQVSEIIDLYKLMPDLASTTVEAPGAEQTLEQLREMVALINVLKTGVMIGAIAGAKVGRRATGGPVYAGQTYMVGENGPELLRMGNASGQVFNSSQTAAMTSGWSGGSGGPATSSGVVARYIGPPQFADIVAWLMTMLRLEIGNQGGNVQTVLGQN